LLRDTKAFSDVERVCLDEFCDGYTAAVGQMEKVVVVGHAWVFLIDLFDEVSGPYCRPVFICISVGLVDAILGFRHDRDSWLRRRNTRKDACGADREERSRRDVGHFGCE